MINSYDDLSPVQLDVLKEIGNIGSGNAATAYGNNSETSGTLFSPPIQLKKGKTYRIVADFYEHEQNSSVS